MTDERHAIGANNPPRTVFDEIDDLYLEASNWLDGQPVETLVGTKSKEEFAAKIDSHLA